MSVRPRTVRKLDARFAPVLFGVFTSATFALIMSGVLLLVNRGLVENFIGLWMRNFVVAFLVAFPTSIVVVPLVRRVVASIVEAPRPSSRGNSPGSSDG